MAGAVAGLAAVALGLPAPAAAAYRYWSYWSEPTGSGAWTYARVAASRRPPQGSVEGWRFGVGTASAADPKPRVAATFAQLCGSDPAPAGRKRVGLVVDPGEGYAPRTRCVTVSNAATGYDVLRAGGTSIRAENGLVCALDGVPATGCGDEVPTDATTPARTPATTPAPSPVAGAAGPAGAAGSPVGPVVAALLAGGLGVAAGIQLRRRRP